MLQSFARASDPYAAGQHRGVDIGARRGASWAPASGVVSFAGTGSRQAAAPSPPPRRRLRRHAAPSRLDHRRPGSTVEEGEPVGVVGWSGEPEHDAASVHLGVRVASDPDGYVDPLTLLAPSEPAQPAPEAEAGPPTTPAAPGADGPPEGTTDQSGPGLQTVEPVAAAPSRRASNIWNRCPPNRPSRSRRRATPRSSSQRSRRTPRPRQPPRR